MKRTVAVMLAMMLFGGSLIPRMSMEQATRLPELFSHYHQHQLEEGRNLSFFSFLFEHYALDSQHHKSPNHNHNRLPIFDGGSSAYDFTQTFRLIFEPSVTELFALAVFRVRTMNAQSAFSPLFQPPRF